MIRIISDQHQHFLQQADAFRRSESFCDVVIYVERQTFRAHRLVLACASRVFAQQFGQGDSCSPVHFTLEHFSPRTFQQVLEFTYTQTTEVSLDDLHQLLTAAQLLDMPALEEQCRKQLDRHRVMDEAKSQETSSAKAEHEEKVHEEKLKEASFPQKETNNSSVEDVHPPCTRKKPHLLLRPVSTSSYASPWTFPANVWNPVSAWRQMAENYSDLMAAQASVVHPLTFSAPHVLPLLGPRFQPSAHSSVISYSGFCPPQNLYPRSAGRRGMVKQGLKRRSPTQTSDRSYPEVPQGRKECVRDSRQCRASLRDPLLQDSVPAGAERRGDVVRREPQSHQRDLKGEKPYLCQHCPKRFSLKHQLDTHHRVHTGEKPFECRLCGQRSRDYSAMIKHLRTHGGAAPYRCTVCLEFCSSLVAMERHVKCHASQDFPSDWSINSTYLYSSHI